VLKSRIFWGASLLGALVLFGSLVVLVRQPRLPDQGSATAPPAETLVVARATAVSQTVETLHVAPASTATAVAAPAVPENPIQTAVSPEKAMEVVQQSGLDGSLVTSVYLTTDPTGRPVYEVHPGGPGAAVVRVDAQTGALLAPSG
jgi:uncharacterized membrane protein YkoI